ncbi:MAG TPA: Uma2 family endonuclease [Streptosporangiaceae bacterium]|jgi:Uma2 family endonuclease|nr:Uma2 family endonuclease [Streptosporangiaceae bacterium]
MHAVAYPAHPEPFTIDDLYALPDDGMRHELIDGALLVSPPPANRHQLAVTRFLGLLLSAKPGEYEVLDGPGIRLSPDRLLQPDLIIGPRDALTADVLYLDARDVEAAIEVVSPSSIATDRITKPALYAEAGIGIYIRVEQIGPDAPTVYAYRLESGTYHLYTSAHAGQTLTLDKPFPFSFDPALLSAR